MILLLAAFSCGNGDKKSNNLYDKPSSRVKVDGDSTLYGLACEGCTDSVLVFLSFDGGDPVTFDIIAASKKKKIIGKPETGDWVGVVLNPDDKTKADMEIDLDQLKGTWVYMAMPKIRDKGANVNNVYVDKQEEDSILQSLMVPREIGFALKRNGVAESVGMFFSNTDAENSPVIYPEVRRYSDWGIFNGRLLLSGKAPKHAGKKGMKRLPAVSDTAEFVFMMKDSLQLRFKDGVRNYYRK